MRKQSKRTKSVYTQQPTTNNSCTNHSKVLEQWFASLTLRFRTTFPELSNFARAARLFRMRWYCLAFTYSGWVSSSGSSADIWILPTGCGDVLVVVVLVDPGTEDWWQHKENKNIMFWENGCYKVQIKVQYRTVSMPWVCWAYGASGASSYIFVTDSHSLGGVANSRPANLITQEVFFVSFCLFILPNHGHLVWKATTLLRLPGFKCWWEDKPLCYSGYASLQNIICGEILAQTT